MKNILIVDNDLDFVFRLCQVLDAAGYEAVPATNIPEAVAALKELDVWVDVLIARHSLPGADRFAAELRASQKGQVKAIALLDQNDEPSEPTAVWDGWQVKLNISDATAQSMFVSLVQFALTKGRHGQISPAITSAVSGHSQF